MTVVYSDNLQKIELIIFPTGFSNLSRLVHPFENILLLKKIKKSYYLIDRKFSAGYLKES